MTDIINRIPDKTGERRKHSRIPEQGDNYVLDGLGLAVVEGELQVDAGAFLTLDESTNEVVIVDVGRRYGGERLSLPGGGTTEVWYDVAPNEVVIGSDPGGVAFQLGTVDVDAGTTTAANTDPDMRASSFESESINTESLVSKWDRLVDSTSDLESLPSDIEQGEVVAVAQPDTPYRPASWPGGGKRGQIDVSDIKLVFESKYAANGEPVIKPADGADIGGLEFGFNSAIENIEIHGWGYDGNESTMDDAVTGLCSLYFGDVTHSKIWDYFIKRTHPYHTHNDLNSAIILDRDYTQEDIDIALGRVTEVGDRSVMMGRGTDISVRYNRFTDGFDRAVTFSTGLSDSKVIGNYMRDNAEGSMIKGPDCTGCLFADNTMLGLFRGAVELGFNASGGGDNIIRGNYIHHTETDGTGGAVSNGILTCEDDLVEGNTIIDTASGGEEFIQCIDTEGATQILDNTIKTDIADAMLFNSGEPVARGNLIRAGRSASNIGRVRLNTADAKFIDNDVITYGGVIIKGDGVQVIDNDISLYGQGVPIRDDADVTGVQIKDNTFTNVDSKFGPQGIINLNNTGTTGVIEGNVERDNPNASHFVDLGATEVVVRNNESYTSGLTFWTVDTTEGNAPVEASGNSTPYQYDAAPSVVRDFTEYLASSSWDPDSDGNGEVVMTDDGGTSWHEVVDLPNA